MKKKTVQNVLTRYLENNKTISTSKLLELLAAEEAEVKISSIRWYLYEFKREGLIADVSRGVYSLQRHNFSPDLKLHNIKKLSNKIHSNLPFLKHRYIFNKVVLEIGLDHLTGSLKNLG